MNKRRLPQLFALALVGLVSVCTTYLFSANAQKKAQKSADKPAQATCSAEQRAEIVKKIRDAMKADPQFKGQWDHIYVDIGIDKQDKQQKVFLMGWTQKPQNRTAMERITNKVLKDYQCVKIVKSRMGSGTMGCDPPEFKKCPNGACIRTESDCNAETLATPKQSASQSR